MRVPGYIKLIEDDAEANAALQEYLDTIKNGGTTYVLISARKKSDGNSLLLTEDDISLNGGITITTVLNSDEDLIFGSAVSTECKIEFIKNENTEDIDFDKALRINIGIDINGTIRYATVGVFYGDEPKTVISNAGNDSFEFVGYDYISKTDVSADDFIATLTFPMSLSDLATAFLNFYGVGIRFDSISYSINIENNPFDAGTTIRDILHWLAESQGCYALMYLDDIQVAIRRFETLEYPIYYPIDYTITPDEYFTINKSRIEVPAVPVLKFVSTKYPSKNAQYPTTPVLDGVPYTIVDNPIMANATSISGALDGAYSRALEYGRDTDNPIYIPMNVSAIGNWLIEAGDIINVEDMDGNTTPMRIFSRVLRWAGSCTDYYECTGNAVRKAMTEDEKTAYQVKQVVGNMTANNLTTTTKGMVLDASQGQILNNSISTLADKVDVIGTTKSNSSSGTINCSENTKSAGCSITITPGTWIVSANATIYKCVSGKRQGLTVTSNSAAGQYNRYCYELRNSPASTTANQYYNVSHVWTVSANTTLYVMLYNGNVSTSYEASIDAVRIL